MDIHYKHIPFERYADDTICHCKSQKQAEWIKGRIIKRFEECGLKLNETKTRIVCYTENKYKGQQSYENVKTLSRTILASALLVRGYSQKG